MYMTCTCTGIYLNRAENLYPAIGHFLVISPLCPGTCKLLDKCLRMIPQISTVNSPSETNY